MSLSGLSLDRVLQLGAALAPDRTRYGVRLHRGHRIVLGRHPDSPDPTDLRAVRAWVKEAEGSTAVDMFCGAGGLSLGLAESGFSVLAGADSDPVAMETYAANFPGLTYVGDLSDPADFLQHLDAWRINRVDLVAGGVPCQPFSRAGRSKIRSLVEARVRAKDDKRVDLWRSLIEVVKVLRPGAVLLENVPDLAEWDDGAVLVGFCESLQELGYNADARIVPAYEHGVPQHRSRLFIVGLRGQSQFRWPKSIGGPTPTLWDAISDLPVVEGGQRVERLPYEGPRSSLQKTLRSQIPPSEKSWVNDHITRYVRTDDLAAFTAIPEGGTYVDVPTALRRYRSDIFSDKYKRLSKRELSRTITAHMAKDGYQFIHPVQHRTLSIREAARVQTIPDRFRFAGEPSHRYRQIGNAVPPLLGAAVGRAVIQALSETGRRSMSGRGSFREALLAWRSRNEPVYSWRSGSAPWIVLLAEICLQRTRVEQVKSVLPKLIKTAPSPNALIRNRAAFEHIIGSLERPRTTEIMIRIAEVLVERHGGKVPKTREELQRLPGVGEYVANAVLCFGFGRQAVLLDASTERILRRFRGHDAPTGRWQRRLDLYRLAGPLGADRDFNSGLLDLAALVCRPTSPRCGICPLAQQCATASLRT